jgi:hypothetical protein
MCACAPSLKGFFTEGIGQPIATAYRRGSKHISSSLASIYSNGSRFHHPADHKPRKPSHPHHAADKAPLRAHARKPSSASDKPNFSIPQYHARVDSRSGHVSPQRPVTPQTPTPPPVAAFTSPRTPQQPYMSPRTHVAAQAKTSPYMPSAAMSPPRPSPAANPTSASRRSRLGSPISLHHHSSNASFGSSRMLRKPSRDGNLVSASPTTGATELQERARMLHMEKLREEREREAEEESRAAEVNAARRAAGPAPDSPSWNGGLNADEAWQRYQRGMFGPLPPPKDLHYDRGSKAPDSSSTLGSEYSKTDSGSMV